MKDLFKFMFYGFLGLFFIILYYVLMFPIEIIVKIFTKIAVSRQKKREEFYKFVNKSE